MFFMRKTFAARFLWLALFCASVSSSRADSSADWYKSLAELESLFTEAAPFARMADSLDYFTRVFTAIGYAAVIIAAVRKVAKARTGEESMGWVASTMITIALMATAPAIGKNIFSACDEIAKDSSYSESDAITTCWYSLIVILPGPDSPIADVLRDAQKPPVSPPTSANNDDAPFTKLAWTWMKMAWTSMTDALDKITAAFRTVVNHIVIIVLLFIPTIALVGGMLAVELGMLVRALLQTTLQIFLPMMIAFLSFAPMRGAATNFIIKYVSIAFWPVAWALGNAVACSLLTSVMDWVVRVCTATMTELHAQPVGPVHAGLLVASADFLSWSSLIVIVIVVSVSSSMILVSAVGAPLAFTSLITSGTTFVGEQFGLAMRSLSSTNASDSSAGGVQGMTSTPSRGFISGALSRVFNGENGYAASSEATSSSRGSLLSRASGGLSRLLGTEPMAGEMVSSSSDRALSIGRSMLDTVPGLSSAPSSPGERNGLIATRKFKRSS